MCPCRRTVLTLEYRRDISDEIDMHAQVYTIAAGACVCMCVFS